MRHLPAVLLFGSLLAACGGGQTPTEENLVATGDQPATNVSPEVTTDAVSGNPSTDYGSRGGDTPGGPVSDQGSTGGDTSGQ